MQSVQPKYGTGMTLCACLWLGLFPLLQGGTYARLTRDKWIIMLALCGVTVACFLFDLLRGALRRPRGKAAWLPAWALLALALWTVVSCLVSPYPAGVWWIAEGARREGLASRLCYFGLFLCFFFSRVRIRPLLYSALFGVLAFCAVVLLQRAGGNPLGLYPGSKMYADHPEFQGTIGNIDMGTGYLCMLAGLFSEALLLKRKARDGFGASIPARRQHETKKPSPIDPGICLVALAVSVFLIVTMGVQFGAVTLAALALFTVLRFLPKKKRILLLAILLILALLAVWFWPGHSGGVWELHEILHGRGRLSFGSNRIAVWVYTLRMAGERLLTGGGNGTFPDRFEAFLRENGLTIPEEQDGVALPHEFDNPHSEYLSLLADNGLPALLLMLLLLSLAMIRKDSSAVSFRAVAKKETQEMSLCFTKTAVFCYAVQAVFSFSVCIVAPMFWVLFGMSFSRQE